MIRGLGLGWSWVRLGESESEHLAELGGRPREPLAPQAPAYFAKPFRHYALGWRGILRLHTFFSYPCVLLVGCWLCLAQHLGIIHDTAPDRTACPCTHETSQQIRSPLVLR